MIESLKNKRQKYDVAGKEFYWYYEKDVDEFTLDKQKVGEAIDTLMETDNKVRGKVDRDSQFRLEGSLETLSHLKKELGL